MSQNDDIMLRTGARRLSDIGLTYGEDESGYCTVKIPLLWALSMRRHHPDLFANEAVMHLIESCCVEAEWADK